MGDAASKCCESKPPVAVHTIEAAAPPPERAPASHGGNNSSWSSDGGRSFPSSGEEARRPGSGAKAAPGSEVTFEKLLQASQERAKQDDASTDEKWKRYHARKAALRKSRPNSDKYGTLCRQQRARERWARAARYALGEVRKSTTSGNGPPNGG
mmetsp:Transcript_32014/g.75047  ORF Transcript_32014/g.75047 Transcript_32014/m.75047 type:complete len:154 (-) Transcript_32014:76-537(-)